MLVLKRLYEAKARNLQKVKQSLSGKNDLVKTWGITAENPMGHAFSSEENAKRDRELRSYLAKNHIEYIKVQGKYGNPENSLFLINPALSDMKKVASVFGQESFIFAKNSNGEDGNAFDAGYYETSAPSKIKEKFADPEYSASLSKPLDYSKSITKNRMIDQKDADDFFTSIQSHGRSFKFQIPFFESVVKEAYNRVAYLTKGKDQDSVHYDINRTTIDADRFTEGCRWRIRGSLYNP